MCKQGRENSSTKHKTRRGRARSGIFVRAEWEGRGEEERTEEDVVVGDVDSGLAVDGVGVARQLNNLGLARIGRLGCC